MTLNPTTMSPIRSKSSGLHRNSDMMKRSKTAYSASNSSMKCFGIHLKVEQTDLPTSPRNHKTSFSQANASWGHPSPSASCSRDDDSQKRTRNIFLQNDQEINSLLTLLRTNDFSGHIDPLHHSEYMKEPRSSNASKRKPRSLGQRNHLSDGHLLQNRCKSGSLDFGS